MAKLRSIFGGLLVAMALAAVAHGQATGEIAGVVSGPGGPLANLRVNIIDVTKGTVAGTATTSANGAYSLANLLPGNYTVQVLSSTGAVLNTTNALVSAGAATTANLTLTASQLAAAGIAAGGGAAIGGGLSTATILGIAGGSAAAIATTVALRDDPSPTQ
jgi:large repetitive protein